MTILEDTKLSIVIPVYNAEKTIAQLVNKLIGILPQPLEIVLVNDGSWDNSDRVCQELQSQFSDSVKYVALSKNYGEHNAVMAGLTNTTGDYVVIMDDDFQNPPTEVLKLVNTAKENDYDVVYSAYETKKDSWFRNAGSKFINLLTVVMIKKPKGLYLSSFKCLNRFLVDQVLKYDGPYPYLDGLIFRVTDKYGVVEVEHHAREEGQSGYTLRKLISLTLNMFLNFSLLPLRCVTMLGLCVTACAALYSVYVLVYKMLWSELPEGWATTIIAVALFGGVQLVTLGVLGEYVGRIFLVQNKTPQFCVRRIYKK